MEALAKSAWISLGAIVGANLRYWIGAFVAARFSPQFPWATLAINVFGSILIGSFYAWETRSGGGSVPRLIFAVGFCGGFTTFSAFSLESLQMIQKGAWVTAGLYALGSFVLTIAGCAIGFALGSIIKV